MAPRKADSRGMGMDAERSLNSHNIAFLEALYEQYEQDPESVDPDWRALIEYERGRTNGHSVVPLDRRAGGVAAPMMTDVEQVALQNEVDRLIEHYRLLGHLRADVDPLGRQRRETTDALDLEYFRLGAEQLDRQFHPGRLFAEPMVKLRDILERLQRTYCRRVGVEYWQINDVEVRSWLREYMESVQNEVLPDEEQQRRLLRLLMRAEEVDRFLHQKFIGAKRFSASGAESVLIFLESLIEASSDEGVNQLLIAMAHRGRLSVMMNIMGQSAFQIFSRFEGDDPYMNLGSGDVKYHLGCYRNATTTTGQEHVPRAHVQPQSPRGDLARAGGARAGQPRPPARARESSVLGVTLHGDAAVMGQGVYAETLNLSQPARLRQPGHGARGGEQPSGVHHQPARRPLHDLRDRGRRHAQRAGLPHQR